MPAKKYAKFDEHSFKCLFDIYKNRLYGYVLTISRSEYIAEEITQEIFIKLWLCRHLLDHVDNLDSYIFTIARHKTLNYFRKAASDEKLLHRLQASMVPTANDVEEQALLADCDRLLQEAIDHLSPQRRLVYQLSRNQGLKLEEIALKLKLSRNTVKNHLVEALKLIRVHLGDHQSSVMGLAILFMCQIYI